MGPQMSSPLSAALWWWWEGGLVNDMLQDGPCSAQECYLGSGGLSLRRNSMSAVSWWLGLAVNHATLLSKACLD